MLRLRSRRRWPMHLGPYPMDPYPMDPYPMEKIRRVGKPTTLITDNIRRDSKRADGFV